MFNINSPSRVRRLGQAISVTDQPDFQGPSGEVNQKNQCECNFSGAIAWLENNLHFFCRPAKQYISEDSMITRLSTMRLTDASFEDDINLEESDEETMHQPFPVNLTPQELEQRLKNASRITVIKSIQKSLKQNPEMAIPPSILERMEQQPRPSMAVVLWQPPLRFLGQPNAGYDHPTSSEEEDDPYMDANNNNNDPNNNNNNNEVEDMDL